MAASPAENPTRQRELLWTTGIFLLANIADLLATTAFLAVGVDEGMPIPSQILAKSGIEGLAVYKLFTTTAGVAAANFAYYYPKWDTFQGSMENASLMFTRAANICVTSFAVTGLLCALANPRSAQIAAAVRESPLMKLMQ